MMAKTKMRVKMFTSYDTKYLEEKVDDTLANAEECEDVEIRWGTNVATFDTLKGKRTHVMHSVLLIFRESTDV